MSLEEQLENAKDPGLRQRIRMASVVAAIQVQGENKGAMSDGEFAKRQDLATRVITTAGLGTPTDDIAKMFVYAVCSNAAINPESVDGDIQFTVNSVWSDCAGVTGIEP